MITRHFNRGGIRYLTGAVLFLLCAAFGVAAQTPEPEQNGAEQVSGDPAPEKKAAEESPERPQAKRSKPSQKSRKSSGPVDMSQRITLDLRNMPVNDALKYIALRSGLNIVTSKAVTGQVTFQLEDVPLKDIFDITLLSNNLAYEKIGEIYYVMTEKEYEARYGKSFSDAREVKTFHLKYAIPEKAFDVLDTLKSNIGRVLVDQETGTVMIMDTPEKIEEMVKALNVLEQKNDVTVFNLQYAEAKDIEEQLRAQLDDKKVGSIRSDSRSNQVIVQALPERMDDIAKLIEALDRKTKEVLIDAKILKVTLNDDLSVGFEWEGMFKNLTKSGATAFLGSHPLQPVERIGRSFIDDFTTIQPDANPPAGNKTTLTEQVFFGRTIGDDAYELLVRFLQTLGETRLLSNPKLAVVNKEEAKILIGRREAFVTTTTTTGQTTTTTAEEVTFIDVGIQLNVTPTINEEGFITMKVKPEVSSVVDTLVTPSGNRIPIVDTSTAETTVMVKDNATIIIGGLRREDETLTEKQVPFLGDIPFLGALFSSKDTTKQRSELLVLLTPHIIEGDMLNTGDDDPSRESKPPREYSSIRAEQDSGVTRTRPQDPEEREQLGMTEPEDFGELKLKPYR